MEKQLEQISMTGRLCYLFMCIEKYLVTKYPKKDWSFVAKRMWQWTNMDWEDGYELYSVVVPECILECENVDVANDELGAELTEEQFEILTALLSDLSDGSGTSEFDRIMYAPMEFGDICADGDLHFAMENTADVIMQVVSMLEQNGIEAPSFDLVKQMSIKENNGWGKKFDSTKLSIIL